MLNIDNFINNFHLFILCTCSLGAMIGASQALGPGSNPGKCIHYFFKSFANSLGMVTDKILNLLKDYTGKSNIAITTRGNDSILRAFEILKKEGCEKILFPDQGGWWKCPDIATKAGLEFGFLETKDGYVDLDLLKNVIKDYDSFYVCSFGGYFVEQNLLEIYDICRENNCLLVVDACSAVGVQGLCDVGDIIIGSFGRWKVVDYGSYGFIASDLDFHFNSLNADDPKLLEKLENASKRFDSLVKLNFEVKNDLKDFKIYFPDSRSLNVVVDKDDRILDYCTRKGYEYQLCPVYNRINKEAISIELKRLKEEEWQMKK